MAQPKIIRRQKKAAVTRHLGTLERLIAEEDIELVRTKLKQLKVSFGEFEMSHDTYHDSLSDEEEIAESERWFKEAEKAYIDGIKSAKAWIKSQAAPVKVPPVHKYDHDEEEPVLAYLTNMMNMPKVELDKFDGNPLDFQSFIAVFDEVVDSKIDDDQVKLTRLLQYTSGQAKTAIKNCALVGGETGYKQAREILRSRFGNAHLVSQSIISDLKNGKYVTKAQDLQQLSDDLCMALTALEKLEMYYEVNTQQCVLDILSRCQTYIQRRWRKKALEMKTKHDAYPSFKDFVEFIKLIASEACDPVYGSHQSRSQVKGASCNAVTTHQQAKYRYPGSFLQGNEQSQHRHNLSNDNCVVCN